MGDALAGGGAGKSEGKRNAAADGEGNVVVGRNVAGVEDADIQKLARDFGDAVVNDFGLGGGPHLIDQETDAMNRAIAGDHLDDGVGVRDGGGFGRGDDQHVVGSAGEGEDVGTDACAGVDEDDVGLKLEFGEGANEALAVVIGQVGHAGQARCAADKLEAARAFDHHFAQLFFSGDDVGKIEGEVDVAQDIGVGQAQVGVE